jgi:hypothetical protein
MPAKKHTPEQIIAKLREAEVEIAKGHPVPIAAKKIGVTDPTIAGPVPRARADADQDGDIDIDDMQWLIDLLLGR